MITRSEARPGIASVADRRTSDPAGPTKTIERELTVYDEVEALLDWLERVALGELDELWGDRNDDPDPEACHADDEE
jgi:hypothetical protein